MHFSILYTQTWLAELCESEQTDALHILDGVYKHMCDCMLCGGDARVSLYLLRLSSARKRNANASLSSSPPPPWARSFHFGSIGFEALAMWQGADCSVSIREKVQQAMEDYNVSLLPLLLPLVFMRNA